MAQTVTAGGGRPLDLLDELELELELELVTRTTSSLQYFCSEGEPKKYKKKIKRAKTRQSLHLRRGNMSDYQSNKVEQTVVKGMVHMIAM